MDKGDISAFGESLTRILQDADLNAVRADPHTGAQSGQLWRELSDNGFPLIGAPENEGGLGADLSDILPLVVITGQFALPLPLADTMVANSLLAASSAPPVATQVSLSRARAGNALTYADGTLTWSDTGAHTAPDWLTKDAFLAWGAITRAAQMAGAMQSVLDITLQHTSTREQFGRPLSKFQAIQHHLSDIASETAASAAAIDLARDALVDDPQCVGGAMFDIACAKTRCAIAADIVAAAAHQAHGAIGFTQEYSLGNFTRSLWQWRDEFGSETFWSQHLGKHLIKCETPSIWGEVSR